MKSSKVIIIILFFISLNLLSCEFFTSSKDSDKESKKSDFNGPEEFVDNPSISDAIDDSDINVYMGDDPPE